MLKKESTYKNIIALSLTRTPIRALSYATATALFALLYHLGSKPFAVGLIPPPWDKLAHFVLFSVLTLLLWIGTGGKRPISIVAIVTVLGVFDEIHQAFLPGRTADPGDLLTDFCAAVITVMVLRLLTDQFSRGSSASRF
jgi:hypothetical protein